MLIANLTIYWKDNVQNLVMYHSQSNIKYLNHNMSAFKSSLKDELLSHSCYPVQEFTSTEGKCL
jgi:hypothetical protein